tara:strand:+ start:1448 stop:1939 length:492 start_codon:yes stop_codon:yes gene_type:complete
LLALAFLAAPACGDGTKLKPKPDITSYEDVPDISDTNVPDEGSTGDADATATDPACDGKDEGDPCDDGDICTAEGTCIDGLCVAEPNLREQMICDDVDEDCDGITDEDCTFKISGGVFGDGHRIGTDPESHSLFQSTGVRRFTGNSTDGQFILRAGMPEGDKP